MRQQIKSWTIDIAQKPLLIVDPGLRQVDSVDQLTQRVHTGMAYVFVAPLDLSADMLRTWFETHIDLLEDIDTAAGQQAIRDALDGIFPEEC